MVYYREGLLSSTPGRFTYYIHLCLLWEAKHHGCTQMSNVHNVRHVDSTATKSKHWKIIRVVIFHSVLYHVDQNWSDSYWLAGYFLQRLIIRVYNWLSTLPRFHCWDSFTVLSFQAQFIYHILSSHFSCICGMSGSLEERKTWFSRRVWVNFLRLNWIRWFVEKSGKKTSSTKNQKVEFIRTLKNL